jgi:hypothetical protein
MRLDGNAAAGDLRDVFAFDPTLALATCASCGATRELGASHAYLDAPGVVLRCASCEAVLLRAVRTDARTWIELSGCASIEVPGAGRLVRPAGVREPRPGMRGS